VPGTAGSGGAFNADADADASGLEWGGMGGDNGGSGWQCPEDQCSCSDCITGVAFSDPCSEAIGQCTQTKCNVVLQAYYDCQTQSVTGATVGQRELESCLFQRFQDKANADPHYHDGIEQFMQWMMPCMVNECATHCVPTGAQACLACQEKSCGDEMRLFRSDSNAILNIWCRSYCQLNQNESCPSMCSQYLKTDANNPTPNQETIDALGAYGECALRCPDC
jgi:hypothetical protein